MIRTDDEASGSFGNLLGHNQLPVFPAPLSPGALRDAVCILCSFKSVRLANLCGWQFCAVAMSGLASVPLAARFKHRIGQPDGLADHGHALRERPRCRVPQFEEAVAESARAVLNCPTEPYFTVPHAGMRLIHPGGMPPLQGATDVTVAPVTTLNSMKRR